MAYLRLGYDPDKLWELYEREAPELDDDQVARRFGGANPRFLGDPDAAPTYNEFRAVLYVDGHGRQYMPAGESRPRTAFVRLPKGLLTRQRRELRETGSIQTHPSDDGGGGSVVDFPSPDERVVLSVVGSRRRNGSAFDEGALASLAQPPEVVDRDSIALVVDHVSVPDGRMATAVVEFYSDLPQASAVPDSTVGRRTLESVLKGRGSVAAERPVDDDEEAVVGSDGTRRGKPRPRSVIVRSIVKRNATRAKKVAKLKL